MQCSRPLTFMQYFLSYVTLTVADPDLKLKGGGGGLDLLAMAAIFPTVISSFFLPKIRGGAPPLDPPLIRHVR